MNLPPNMGTLHRRFDEAVDDYTRFNVTNGVPFDSDRHYADLVLLVREGQKLVDAYNRANPKRLRKVVL